MPYSFTDVPKPTTESQIADYLADLGRDARGAGVEGRWLLGLGYRYTKAAFPKTPIGTMAEYSGFSANYLVTDAMDVAEILPTRAQFDQKYAEYLNDHPYVAKDMEWSTFYRYVTGKKAGKDKSEGNKDTKTVVHASLNQSVAVDAARENVDLAAAIRHAVNSSSLRQWYKALHDLNVSISDFPVS